VASATSALALLEAMRGNRLEAEALVGRSRSLVDDLGVRLTIMVVAQVATLVALHADDADAAVRAARAGYETAKSLGAEGSRTELAALLGHALFAAGRDDEAEVFAEEAAAAEGDRVDNVRWRTVKAHVLARRGDGAEAERLAREAVDLAATTDFLRLHGDALLGLCASLTALGDAAGADAARAEAIALYEQKGDVVAAARASTLGVERSATSP
jgi:tetratricopeptide (TPR) repeat protein